MRSGAEKCGPAPRREQSGGGRKRTPENAEPTHKAAVPTARPAGWDWEVLGKIQVVVNNGKKLLFLT